MPLYKSLFLLLCLYWLSVQVSELLTLSNRDWVGGKERQLIEKNALDGCPGIEKEGRLLSEAKGHGERERL